MKDISELDLWNQPEEGDPLVWLRRHREEISRQYPSIEALGEYLKQFGSTEESLARIHRKIEEQKRKEISR